jgi:hypothetical protein
MNPGHILHVFNRHGVKYLLIGGMNIFLRHQAIATSDVDLWIEDSADNLLRCHNALVELAAEWGENEASWGPVAEKPADWLHKQQVFCLLSTSGSIDIFRSVTGLNSWDQCRVRAVEGKIREGVSFMALGDEDMLQCQLALPENQQKKDRIRILKESIKQDER